MISDHNRMKLEINNRKTSGKAYSLCLNAYKKGSDRYLTTRIFVGEYANTKIKRG